MEHIAGCGNLFFSLFPFRGKVPIGGYGVKALAIIGRLSRAPGNHGVLSEANLKAHASSDSCKIAFPKGRDRLSAEKAFSSSDSYRMTSGFI